MPQYAGIANHQCKFCRQNSYKKINDKADLVYKRTLQRFLAIAQSIMPHKDRRCTMYKLGRQTKHLNVNSIARNESPLQYALLAAIQMTLIGNVWRLLATTSCILNCSSQGYVCNLPTKIVAFAAHQVHLVISYLIKAIHVTVSSLGIARWSTLLQLYYNYT